MFQLTHHGDVHILAGTQKIIVELSQLVILEPVLQVQGAKYSY